MSYSEAILKKEYVKKIRRQTRRLSFLLCQNEWKEITTWSKTWLRISLTLLSNNRIRMKFPFSLGDLMKFPFSYFFCWIIEKVSLKLTRKMKFWVKIAFQSKIKFNEILKSFFKLDEKPDYKILVLQIFVELKKKD